ncbi:hypothetical protein DPMN_101249 [Dreissena polymorpha]|uniref:Uncharacterized protein n=1 Tax=Dreissena polymorpha TaxID=45954 RepID=A0A9D4LIK3_DREPO|nr:hypothetical protein DPMN_101249 [Dreissena polymorpha]
MTGQFFLLKLITELERNHGLKIFVPWRDNLTGGSDNTVCAQLIEQSWVWSNVCPESNRLAMVLWIWCPQV